VTVAVVVWVPAFAPKVRVVPAIPLASVVLVVGATDPPPDAADQVTDTPATGLLLALRAITESAVPSA